MLFVELRSEMLLVWQKTMPSNFVKFAYDFAPSKFVESNKGNITTGERIGHTTEIKWIPSWKIVSSVVFGFIKASEMSKLSFTPTV